MSNENRIQHENWDEFVLSLFYIKYDPSGSGRKWLMRHDGVEIEGSDNMTVEKFERIAKAYAKRKDEELILKSEAIGL